MAPNEALNLYELFQSIVHENYRLLLTGDLETVTDNIEARAAELVAEFREGALPRQICLSYEDSGALKVLADWLEEHPDAPAPDPLRKFAKKIS